MKGLFVDTHTRVVKPTPRSIKTRLLHVAVEISTRIFGQGSPITGRLWDAHWNSIVDDGVKAGLIEPENGSRMVKKNEWN